MSWREDCKGEWVGMGVAYVQYLWSTAPYKLLELPATMTFGSYCLAYMLS
jgi:hypothetical protein